VRTKKLTGGVTTLYIGAHQERELPAGVVTNYIFAGNQRIAKKVGSVRHYFHQDHLGSATQTSDSNGDAAETTEYLPFGAMWVHSGTVVSNYKYTDQELDPESGLYNYDARLYDPLIGRFISADSIVQDFFDPQLINRYTYCRNNPLIYSDPSGHSIPPSQTIPDDDIGDSTSSLKNLDTVSASDWIQTYRKVLTSLN